MKAAPTGEYTYLQFMTPGVPAQSVMFVAIFYGITVVWERDLGVSNKLLSTPAPRASIVLGEVPPAGERGILQAVTVLVPAFIFGVKLSPGPLNVLGAFGVIILFGACFPGLIMCPAALTAGCPVQ